MTPREDTAVVDDASSFRIELDAVDLGGGGRQDAVDSVTVDKHWSSARSSAAAVSPTSELAVNPTAAPAISTLRINAKYSNTSTIIVHRAYWESK